MANELIKQEQQSLDIQRIPRSTKLGPLSYGEWDLEFLSFFLSFSAKSYGESATKVLQGNAHVLVDQFLTIDQADLDACYEVNKETNLPKIDKWPMTLLHFFEMFTKKIAKKLKQEPEEVKSFAYSYLGLRAAQATLNMKGEVESKTLDSLNSDTWLGNPSINVKLFR